VRAGRAAYPLRLRWSAAALSASRTVCASAGVPPPCSPAAVCPWSPRTTTSVRSWRPPGAASATTASTAWHTGALAGCIGGRKHVWCERHAASHSGSERAWQECHSRHKRTCCPDTVQGTACKREAALFTAYRKPGCGAPAVCARPAGAASQSRQARPRRGRAPHGPPPGSGPPARPRCPGPQAPGAGPALTNSAMRRVNAACSKRRQRLTRHAVHRARAGERVACPPDAIIHGAEVVHVEGREGPRPGERPREELQPGIIAQERLHARMAWTQRE